MTLFRNNKNGLLYTIHLVSPRMHTGSWHEATPFRHSTPVHARKIEVDLEDFTAIAAVEAC